MTRSNIALALLALAVLAVGASAADAKLRGTAAPAKQARIVPRQARSLLATTQLSLDYPTNGQVDDGAYNDYYLSWLDIDFPLTIQVSTNMGDADLYVGCGDYYTDADYPSGSKGALWQSNNAGPDDSVTIESRDDIQACPNPSTDDILIGVLGFVNSTYTIMAHAGSNAEELYDAEPVSDGVDEGQYLYYTYSYATGDVEITLTPEDDGSDTDLYVNCVGDAMPSTSNSLWSSAVASGDDVVDVQQSDSNYCSDGFQIAVYGYRAGSMGKAEFDIAASSGGGAEELYESWPVDGYVDNGQYVYYSYYPPYVGGVTITVNSLSGADIDVYTACSNEDLPTTSHNDRSSSAAGSTPDVVVYRSSDRDYCTDGEEIMIGCYGFAAGEYTIEAVDDTGSQVALKKVKAH